MAKAAKRKVKKAAVKRAEKLVKKGIRTQEKKAVRRPAPAKRAAVPAVVAPKAIPVSGIITAASKQEVVDTTTLNVAVETVQRMKGLADHIHNDYETILVKQRAACDETRKRRDEKITPLTEAIDALTGKIKSYNEKIEKEAEAKAEEEMVEKRKIEKLQRRSLAAEMIESGDEEGARKLLAQASDVVAPVVEHVQVTGMSRRRPLTWEVTDITKINADYLLVDKGKITKLVRELKEDAIDVVGAGLRVFSKSGLAFKKLPVVPED